MPRALDTSLRVAVIGGGPAGITAATYLEDAGIRKVTVFEREPEVGGKCKTIFVSGRAHDMGAVELTPDYINTLELASRTDANPLVDVPPTLYRDRATGVAQPPQAWIPPSHLPAVGAAVGKYFQLRAKLEEESPAFHTPGLLGATPDLAVSFAAWLHVNGLDALRGLFGFPITCFGYGPLDAIPALYALKFMNLPNFAVAVGHQWSVDLLPVRYRQAVAGWPKRFKLGFQTLMDHLAKRLSVKPITGATITAIHRNDTSGNGPIRVDYTQGGAQRTAFFDRLIIATPRVIAADGSSFVKDLTSEESDLFGKVITQNYYTVLNEPSAVPYATQANLIMNGAPSEPPVDTTAMFPRIWERPGADHGPQWLQTIWYVNEPPTRANSPAPPSVAHVEAVVAADVASQGMTLAGSQQGFGWTYFPHFGSAEIAPPGGTGAHDRLFALQGQNGTFYAGGLMNFELVENTITYSKWLIGTIFA